MVDIVLVCEEVERERLMPLARALAANDCSVDWGPDTAVGTNNPQFDLDEAACVVVAWTRETVRSEAALAQARSAHVRRKLVQTSWDASEPPLFFGKGLSIDFSTWSESTDDDAFREVLRRARALVTIADKQRVRIRAEREVVRLYAEAQQLAKERKRGARRAFVIRSAIFVAKAGAVTGVAIGGSRLWLNRHTLMPSARVTGAGKRAGIASVRLAATVDGIGNGVARMDVAAGGKYIAVTEEGGRLRVYALEEGYVRTLFVGDESVRTSAGFSPDGRRLVVLGQFNNPDLKPLPPKVRRRNSRQFHYVRLVHPDGAILGRFKGHENTVTAASFSPDGKRLVTASDDATARVWDAETSEPIALLPHDEAVRDAKFSPDGANIVTGTRSRVSIWDANTATRLYASDPVPVIGVWYSRDGARFATRGLLTLQVWTVSDHRLLRELRVESPADFTMPAGGRWLVTGSRDGAGLLSDVETGELLVSAAGLRYAVAAVAVAGDGRWFATGGGSSDGIAQIWEVVVA